MNTQEITMNTSPKNNTVISIIGALAIMATTASAAFIVKPVSATSNLTPFNGSYDNTINNSGLSSPLNTGDKVPVTYPTHNSSDYSSGGFRWLPNPAPTDWIMFDLGDEVGIGHVIVWNYQEGVTPPYQTQRGIKSATAEFSTDGVNFGNPLTWTFEASASEIGAISPTINGAESILARYVRLTNIENHGDPSITGFFEIRFTDVHVPEPSSLALIFLGGGIVYSTRRKKR